MANIAEVVERYIKLRDEKAQIKALYEAQVAVIQKQMDQAEVAVLAALDQLGVESAKTSFGTAYISRRTSATVADKDTYMTFIQENDEWPLLEVRANKSSVEQYMKDHNGELPPGINWSEERVVNFRRTP